MNNRSPLKEYSRRLLQQTWLLITGGVGFLVTLVAELFFPNPYVPFVYIAIFIASLIVGGYFAFVELLKDYDELEEKVNNLDDQKPDIDVSFLREDGQISKETTLWLHPMAPEPDFDVMVEEERKKLIANRPNNHPLFGRMDSSSGIVNRHYMQDVEDYLVEYREYLVRVYESTINRANAIRLFVENRGQYPANNVTVELIMPPDFVVPSEHHCFDRTSNDRRITEYLVSAPRPPKAFLDISSMVNLPPIEPVGSLISGIQNRANINGPEYRSKGGRIHVAYTIEKLVQHNPEEDFEPFWLWLGNMEQSDNWEIPVRITSSDLRSPEAKKLLIRIENNKV